MKKIVAIIPSRLNAKRLPNKPLKLIRDKEMILHVYDAVKKSKVGKVYVATPDRKIFNLIKKERSNAIITKKSHKNGTDRIFEVYEKTLKKKPDIIINIQGDMPNINPSDIKLLAKSLIKNKYDMATLASDLDRNEVQDTNVVKVLVDKKIKKNKFSKAIDFRRIIKDRKNLYYHHIGIYCFSKKGIEKYVKYRRSKLEKIRRLEQMRALENKLDIFVGYSSSPPLSVDNQNDLNIVKKIMDKNDKN